MGLLAYLRGPSSRYVSTRTEEHEALIRMLDDWLQQPAIVNAAIGSGVATKETVFTLRRDIGQTKGEFGEAKVRAFLAALLASRDVRLVVAKFLVKHRGYSNKKAAMRALLAITALTRAEED